MTTDNILIVGTGALATLFAARLAAQGADVTMLGTWKNGIESLRKDGARWITSEGYEKVFPVRVTNDPSECKDMKHAIVLVKSWQTERAAHQLKTCLPDDGLALTLQNGMGNKEILSSALGSERVAIGVTTTGATLLGPGLVRSGGEGIISLEAHPRLLALTDRLKRSGFSVQIVPDAKSILWGKLIINAAINPLTALLRVPNGELIERPSARIVMGRLALEAAAVARAHGINLPFADPISAAEDVARRTAQNRSSMFQDVKRGAPTEIDAICGAIVRSGEQKGVPAPVNWAMWRLVDGMARG
jgi:2-dehydropantoate 2-reductase